MNRDQFTQEQQYILDELDSFRPRNCATVSLSSVDKHVRKAWFFNIALITSATIGSLVPLFERSGLDPFHATLNSVMTSIFLSSVYGCCVHSRAARSPLLHQKMVSAFYGLMGRDLALSHRQAEDVVRWASENPRIHDTCVEWCASNADNLLTQSSYKHLKRIVDKLNRLKSQWERQAMEAEEKANVASVLNKNGLMDEALARGQQLALARTTQQVSSPSRPRKSRI